MPLDDILFDFEEHLEKAVEHLRLGCLSVIANATW